MKDDVSVLHNFSIDSYFMLDQESISDCKVTGFIIKSINMTVYFILFYFIVNQESER